jgi:4-alpha-glucanotransferase
VELAAWGIDEGYWDAAGDWRRVPRETIDAVATAMGAAEGADRPPEGPPMWFVRPGGGEPLASPADLRLEDGAVLEGVTALPVDLPLGYHDLQPLDGGPTTRIVASPGRCHLPADLRAWGWAVQLYATRSRQSWGIGDLADLRRLSGWAVAGGAGVLALNPLHAGGPALPQQPSPYYPSTRRYRNPLYLRIEEVPGATAADVDLAALAAEGRSLLDERLIDRDRVWRLKRAALERCFAVAPGGEAFHAYEAAEGAALQQYATWCAIADEHGNGWQSWPEELRHPLSPGVARFAADHGDAVRFHAWLQWLVDEQLGRAARLPFIADLAVGFDAGGADGWAFQESLALDMRVGAPPDAFNTQGQDWGLPPFVPWKLRAERYDPLVQTLRSSLRHAGGLRVDHVMGLFRLFWIPLGSSPTEGGYVRYRADELLDIVALESHRAGAFVVGEDLGTVEDDARDALTDREVLSYRLLWFEPGEPETWPEQALAAVTTHDLPTVAGRWTGADLDAQQRIGTEPNVEGEQEIRRRLRDLAGVSDDADVATVTTAAYEALARAPSRVRVATLDDALGIEERPNMPGTVDEWPNWSIALPLPIEEIEGHEGVAAVARALGGPGASPGQGR